MNVQEKIFCNFDYFTCMFYDTSFNTVLKWLGMDPDIYVDEFLCSTPMDLTLGINVSKVFNYEGVALSCNLYEYLYGQCNIEVAFDSIFKSVRLDISGSGLKFLRRLGIDVDTKFRDKENYPCAYNVTRCDFSFDLINYMPNFLNDLMSYCRANQTETGCISLMGKGRALKCQVHDCSVRAVYLGAGHRVLRVYDKKLESSDRNTGLYKKENDYGNPDSWTRIELQLRRDKADELLFGKTEQFVNLSSSSDYWLSLFRWIFEFYKFADVENTNSHSRREAEFWSALFDWSKIPGIIQNEKSVQFSCYGDIVLTDAGTIISRIQRDLAALYRVGGKKTLQDVSDAYFNFLWNYDDIRSFRPRQKEISRLNTLLTEGYIYIADSFEECEFGYYRDCNTVRFKWF